MHNSYNPPGETNRERERELARRAALRAAEEGLASRDGIPSGVPSGIPPTTSRAPLFDAAPGTERESGHESERERTRREFLEGLAGEGLTGEARSEEPSPSVGMPTGVVASSASDTTPGTTSGTNPDATDGGLVGRVRHLTEEALLRAVIGAARARLEELGMKNVVETRVHGDGRLQLEYRGRRSRNGEKRGPYWSYKWFEDGRSRSLYLGKTDEPEAVLEEKLSRKPFRSEDRGAGGESDTA